MLGDLVHTVLTEEGYAASVLGAVTTAAIRAAVDRLEPDCLLLDSRGPLDYGESWRDAPGPTPGPARCRW